MATLGMIYPAGGVWFAVRWGVLSEVGGGLHPPRESV